VIPPLAPTFEAALRDVSAQQPRFRSAAAARLGQPPPGEREAAIEGLLALAHDPDGDVRTAAFESLGIVEASEAASMLLEAFDDPHPNARQAAVLALGRVVPGEAAGPIARLLQDGRPEMRFSAVWTLSRLGPEQASSIRDTLQDEDPEIRLLAAECLGELEAKDHANAIADLLDDDSDAVRFGAATALAALGDSRGAPALRAALARADRAFPAAIGLGDLEDQRSRVELAKLARGPWRSPILRAAAARALVRLGDPDGTRVIRKLVRSWRIEARQYAVELVGELGLTSLVPDLARAFRRSRKAELPVYESALEQLAPKSPEAKALLASIRGAHHPV
jgi:HEAT repeat protein